MALNLEERRLRRKLRADEAKARLEKLRAILEPGLTLSNKAKDLWAILLKDASDPGKYRYQTFDRDGFMGHHTFNTLSEAFQDAFQSGFTLHAPNILDKLSLAPAWAKGLLVQEIREKYNAKKITTEEMYEELREVQKQFKEAS